jgi:prepilin-type N-terminal cleavage/methylation domain-containing protein
MKRRRPEIFCMLNITQGDTQLSPSPLVPAHQTNSLAAGGEGRGEGELYHVHPHLNPPPSRGRITWDAGFTLVEVMVSLVVLGFILLIIFGVFKLGFSAWERGDSTKEEYQKVRIVSQLISQQVKSFVPYKIKTKKAEGDYLAFYGKQQSLKFVSTLPIKARQPEGFVYVVYEFKEGKGENGGRLIIYEQRVLNRDFFEDELKEELGISLLEGITNVRFEYYQEEDSDKNLQEGWVEEWNAKETKALPRALKITILQKDGKDEEEEFPITLVASLPAHQFEEVKTIPARFGRRNLPQPPQQ